MESSNIDAVLRDAVNKGAVPQVVAMAADRSGQIYEGSAGPRAAGQEEQVTPDSVFRVASMTKMVATVAALQQVERGELDLDAPVDTIIAEFAEIGVLEGFDENTPRIRPPASRATVKQLLTHTAGFGYWFWNADIHRYEEVTGTPNVLAGKRVSLTAPMVADPGTRFEYGINTDWLGEVVEKVSGKSLKDYLAQNVFEPLGMARTTFSPTAQDRAELVPAHVPTEGGGWVATEIDLAPEPEWWAGGHGLYSTPREYLRFQQALLNRGTFDGATILRPETVDAAFTNQIGGLDFPTHIPSVVPEVSGPWNGPAGNKWGYGLMLNVRREPGMRAPYSGAWAGLFNSHFWVDPRSGVTGAIYSQFLPFITQEALGVYADFERALYASR
ncbi:serine hydrolase domain-containing protein [Pseudonocardia sp. GCM10023141]|uniref:serine hydrolase domain-containing protein n=1 Tax=Pseudonocardia sp. GCM10023141 TaxID=3252653 RepID=UPI003622250F